MNYQLNSYVNRKEAEALKEMIFKRAKERSQVMTSDVQADVMSVARESFAANNNPFAQLLIQNAELNKPDEVKTPENKVSALHEYVEAVEEKAAEVGFPQKQLQGEAITQNRTIQEQASARQIQGTMREAREGLSNKKSFMGALEFLNSQAAVSLMRTRADKFEVLV